ncbi:hypothetical protein AAVH_06107 [Aphelenchoides avenae]|nr:hypothetical protein AAVH_06107 [Aphelenchus avenae]
MSNCSEVLVFVNDVPLRFIHFFQITSSFTGIVAITIALKKRRHKPSLLSEGMGQFLLYCDIALLTGHNLTVIGVQGLHQFQYLFLTSTDLCYAMVVSWKCLSIRVPMFFTVCGLSFSQLLMTLDRALLSFGHGMGAHSLRKLKLISLAILCVSSALICYYAQHNVDMLQRMPYCSNTSDKSKEEMANIYNLLCAMDFTSTVSLLLLLRKNSRDLSRNVHAFHLDAKFRMRNNLASTRFLFALVGIRFLVLGTTRAYT